MQILFDIDRSLKVNPPKYPKGIKFITRESGKLEDLSTTDENGASLQPREKSLEDEQRNLNTSFTVNGVLYDKDVMVVELAEDGTKKLVSGYGRKTNFENMGVTTYFWDVVKFTSPYWKAVWRRRFNAGKDHIAKGTPNTEGTYIKGLVELKDSNSIDYRSDDAIKKALFDMSDGQLDEKSVEKLLKKFRKSNSKTPFVTALSKSEANKAADKLALPTSGYVKSADKLAWGDVGYVFHNGSEITKQIINFAGLFDNYKQRIKITAYVEHTDLDEKIIYNNRKSFIEELNKANQKIRKYLQPKYHNMIEFTGFLAQIGTPDEKQEGKPRERGLVDIDGNIIKE